MAVFVFYGNENQGHTQNFVSVDGLIHSYKALFMGL